MAPLGACSSTIAIPHFGCLLPQFCHCATTLTPLPAAAAAAADHRHAASSPMYPRSTRYGFSHASASQILKVSGENTGVQKLLLQFYADPSQWWDLKLHKKNSRLPDFKHKRTQEAPLIEGCSTPPWMIKSLSAINPGMIQDNAWTLRIERSVKAGKNQKALELFQDMQRQGVRPDRFALIAVLKACARLEALEEGKRVHAEVIRSGCELDMYVGSCLVDMYAKCGSIKDAWSVFSRLPRRTVVTWSIMITAFARSGQGKKALYLFHQMQQQGQVNPDSAIFVGVLTACTSIGALEQGRHMHAQAVLMRAASNSYVENCLIDMYAKCGSIEDACQVFNSMTSHNTVSWNSMIVGYVKCGLGMKAIEIFWQMKRECMEPDRVTYMGVLNACASALALEDGRLVHAEISNKNGGFDLQVANTLIDMYGKCGCIQDAWEVFSKMPHRSSVSWNAIILAFVKCGNGKKALECFQQMKKENVKPDSVTYVGVISACGNTSALNEGRQVHEEVIQNGLSSDVNVGSCLIDMYAKCDSIDDAYGVFRSMPSRNVVSWSTIISGFVKSGNGAKAVELFQLMQQEPIKLDSISYVAIINACASIGALEEGKRVHAEVVRNGFGFDLFVGNALVDMYAKCGSIENARSVFTNLSQRNVVSWNSMLTGHAFYGLRREAFLTFENMCRNGVEACSGTFACLLSACNHTGLVDHGSYFFESMTPLYGIMVNVEHYSCMVDLFARAGCVTEAEDVINRMWCKPDVHIWMALLSACRTTGNMSRAEHAAAQVLKLDPENTSAFMLLSNIHAAAGKMDYSTHF